MRALLLILLLLIVGATSAQCASGAASKASRPKLRPLPWLGEVPDD